MTLYIKIIYNFQYKLYVNSIQYCKYKRKILNRIVPTIKSGNKELILSESFLCKPDDNIYFSIPVNTTSETGSMLEIEFEFIKDDTGVHLEQEILNNLIKIQFYNFTETSASKRTKDWYKFELGELKLYMLMSLDVLSKNLVRLSSTMYREGK